MKVKIIFTFFAVLLLVFTISFSLLPSEVISYSHIHAHMAINAKAFEIFIHDVSVPGGGNYKKYENYNFKETRVKLEGFTVKEADNYEVEEKLVKGNYQFWIEMGGYTADEPEYYSALRHFYDPLKIQTDPATGKKVTYLTDHVSELLEKAAVLFKGIVDPRMDAREWALTGPARRGHKANR